MLLQNIKKSFNKFNNMEFHTTIEKQFIVV